MSGKGGGSGRSRREALTLVGLAYAVALAAGWLTLAFAPIGDPLWRTFAADAVATIVIFGFSFVWDNSSFYDAYWSVIPIAIVLYWMTLSDAAVPGLRLAALGFVVCVWGARPRRA